MKISNTKIVTFDARITLPTVSGRNKKEIIKHYFIFCAWKKDISLKRVLGSIEAQDLAVVANPNSGGMVTFPRINVPSNSIIVMQHLQQAV